MIDYNKFYTIPFEAGGRDLQGCDCYGLFRLLYQELTGKLIPDYNGYNIDHETEVGDKIAEERKTPLWKEVTKPRIGDLVLIRLYNIPQHIGFMVSCDKFLDTTEDTGVKLCRTGDRTYASRIEGYYRYKG